MSDTNLCRMTINEANERAAFTDMEFAALPAPVRAHIAAHAAMTAGNWTREDDRSLYRNRLKPPAGLTWVTYGVLPKPGDYTFVYSVADWNNTSVGGAQGGGNGIKIRIKPGAPPAAIEHARGSVHEEPQRRRAWQERF